MIGEVRHVVDSDGAHWRVYELSGVYYDRRRSLVFESEATIRRLRNFPDDWRALADADLVALSWGA